MLLIEQGRDYEDVDETALPYKHVKNLGHGASGIVEEVMDLNTHMTYARKVIGPLQRMSKAERKLVFERERSIIRGLASHHHVIQVFATYNTARQFGIILQPVASDRDLYTFLDAFWEGIQEQSHQSVHHPDLDEKMRFLERAFGCLAAGLAFIHAKQVRHKDVKPKNILVHRGSVIYTDFGYSFDHSDRERSTTEGIPNALTRQYSSPELLEFEPRNSKSDVYSLGCVFIELLSAATLDQSLSVAHKQSFQEVMDRLHGQLLSMQDLGRLACLPKIIMRMTTRDASERICSIHAAEEILHSPHLCCANCTLSPIEEWKERVHDDDCGTVLSRRI